MITKLTRIGEEVAVILDQSLLDSAGLDENSEVELWIDGDALMIAAKRAATSEEP
jgi:antitoxin component of MazEF toxin-antitoxin module